MNKSRKNHDQYTYIDTVVCVPGLHLGILLFKLKKRKIREKKLFPLDVQIGISVSWGAYGFRVLIGITA